MQLFLRKNQEKSSISVSILEDRFSNLPLRFWNETINKENTLVSGLCPERSWDTGSLTTHQSKLSHTQSYQSGCCITLFYLHFTVGRTRSESFPVHSRWRHKKCTASKFHSKTMIWKAIKLISSLPRSHVFAIFSIYYTEHTTSFLHIPPPSPYDFPTLVRHKSREPIINLLSQSV